MRYNTKLIHIGEEPNLKEGGTGDVVIPIHLSTTFARKEAEKPTAGYEYSRTGNPTRDSLEKKLAVLENARFALAFSSGMAAESTLLLTLLKSGDHIIAFDDLYGGTKRLFKILSENYNIEVSYVDARFLDNVKRAIKKNTRLIWLESPTNPLMKLCDIKEISKIAKENNIITVLDNTFLSPVFQKPLELGADIVIHSTTKYINGHSDSVGGAIMLNDEKIYEKLKFNQNAIGAILSPFDSYMVIRGIKTLTLRMLKHEENAKKIAEFLENHSKVEEVYYPGLKSHPQHELALKQMKGFGGMLSFEIKGKLKDAKKFVESLKIFSLAESLGGVESLIEIPYIMTHASLSEEEKKKVGIGENLIRVSVGIEDVEDLIEDLEIAFSKIS
ncbi:MAG: PLP-dependent aspartate aminotransferase family protein [candidate division WOR-3 bacterium]